MYYDPDVIKSYFSYICHTPARKIPRLTASPLSCRISPFLGSPLPFSNFSIPPFLGTFGKVNPPFLGPGGGWGGGFELFKTFTLFLYYVALSKMTY